MTSSVIKNDASHVSLYFDHRGLNHGWMNGWMTCDFTSFSTVFQSYQNKERLIMKGRVQWNPVYGGEDFTSSGARTRDR